MALDVGTIINLYPVLKDMLKKIGKKESELTKSDLQLLLTIQSINASERAAMAAERAAEAGAKAAVAAERAAMAAQGAAESAERAAQAGARSVIASEKTHQALFLLCLLYTSPSPRDRG